MKFSKEFSVKEKNMFWSFYVKTFNTKKVSFEVFLICSASIIDIDKLLFYDKTFKAK